MIHGISVILRSMSADDFSQTFECARDALLSVIPGALSATVSFTMLCRVPGGLPQRFTGSFQVGNRESRSLCEDECASFVDHARNAFAGAVIVRCFSGVIFPVERVYSFVLTRGGRMHRLKTSINVAMHQQGWEGSDVKSERLASIARAIAREKARESEDASRLHGVEWCALHSMKN